MTGQHRMLFGSNEPNRIYPSTPNYVLIALNFTHATLPSALQCMTNCSINLTFDVIPTNIQPLMSHLPTFKTSSQKVKTRCSLKKTKQTFFKSTMLVRSQREAGRIKKSSQQNFGVLLCLYLSPLLCLNRTANNILLLCEFIWILEKKRIQIFSNQSVEVELRIHSR